MKKIILSTALMISAVVGANAQKAIETSKAFDNVYVGVNVGATTPLELNNVFPLNPQVSVRVGKNITPVFGLAVEGSALFGEYNYGQGIDWFSKTAVKGTNVSLLSTFNLMNAIGVYKGEPRVFEVSTVVGLGWLHYFNSSANSLNDLSAKTGVNFAFNLGSDKAWQVYVEPTVFWNLTQGQAVAPKFDIRHGQLGLFVGVNYKFKTSNGTHNFKVYDISDFNDQINKLRAENSDLASKNAELVNTVAKKDGEITVYKNELAGLRNENATLRSNVKWVVEFEQNSSVLTPRAKEELNKIDTKTAVRVVASASPEGTVEYNEKLSQARADAVAEYLRSRGVVVETADGLGVVDNNSNRISKVTLK